jgi:APA family basic amino acid/polyamine antiporter
MTAIAMTGVLPRRLGALAVGGTVVGIMVGSGIFRVPSTVAQHAPTPLAFMGVWVLGGALAVAGALMMAEFAAMFPNTGGRYVYLREGIHPVAAFAYAIGNILLLRPVSLAARAMLIAAYLATVVPVLVGHDRLVAAIIIVTLSALNYRSTLLGAGIATATSIAKVAALVGVAGLTLLVAPAAEAGPVAASGPVTFKGIGLALVAVMWTYSGWGSTTYITGEVRDAEKTVPRMLLGGVGLVVALFLLINWAYLRAMPIAEIAASDTVAADAAGKVLGPMAAQVIAVLVVVSVLGSLTASMLAAPRLPFAIGTDAPRLRLLARVHSVYGTPHAAVIFTAVLALLFLGRGSFERLVEDYILGSWPFYVLVAVGFFRLRWKRPDASRPFRAPAIAALFFLVASAAMVINGFAEDPIGALSGSWMMLIGIPVYFMVRSGAPQAIR